MTLTRLLTLHTLSPLHCGTGMAVGAIELPIAREKPTHIPIVPGSSIKGVLRAIPAKVEGVHKAAFGPETENASDHAGAVQFSDARLVLMPMRSVAGVFAWTTSPYLLRRFAKDLKEAGLGELAAIQNPKSEQGCFAAGNTALKCGDRVILEDLDFTVESLASFDSVAAALGTTFFPGDSDKDREQQAWLASHLCIVHDNVMGLLLEMGTELQTHIRLNPDTKTVKQGALWQEENLPVESLLAALVLVNGEYKKDGAEPGVILSHLESLCNGQALQFGGKASTGKGLCQVRLAGGAR
jgi:CRISPR-associated protein Cmr4